MTRYKILFVDDDVNAQVGFKVRYEKRGYEVETVVSGEQALEKLKSDLDGYAGAVIDFNLGKMDGASTAKILRKLNPALNIVIYSGQASDMDLREVSWEAGALEIVEKRTDSTELDRAIEDMCRKFEETSRKLSLDERQSSNAKLIESLGMVGVSSALADIAKRVKLYRQNRKNVLILGETGAGKECVAKALHVGPKELFVVVNCANYARNPDLLRSELFGYVKGAFTGADDDKPGFVERANGGTLFLDEAHLLGLEAQAQLLRLTELHEITRVGGTKTYPVNFRLIAVAKPDLESRVEKGNFQPDLFERLNNFRIEIPPLRERPEDIEPLVRLGCQIYQKETGERKTFLMSAIRKLENYHWPRNVRELRNAVEGILYHCPSNTVTPEHLGSKFFRPKIRNYSMVSYAELKQKQENETFEYFSTALSRHMGNVDRAAVALEMNNETLRSIVKRMGLKKTNPKMGASNLV